MNQKRKYAVVRDVHDHRDHLYKADAPIDVPDLVDLRPGCSPIQNQDQLGCCTGFAIVGALEFDENKQREAFVKLSELFVYFNERDFEGDINEDGGAQIRDGIKLIARLGVCQESLWPYNEERFRDRPSLEAFQDGLNHRAIAYKRVIVEQDQFEHALAAGYPIVMGITVFESFESDAVAANGLVPMPNIQTEECMGGHAVLAVGYDRKRRLVIVRNSWGPDWGDHGYFYLPYEFMFGSGLVSDAWTVSQIA
jgi:C1A family cysteine protease